MRRQLHGPLLARPPGKRSIVATMDARNIYERALARAAARVGGIEPLARRLGVPAARLTEWPPQQAHPDMAILLRLMEIVLEE